MSVSIFETRVMVNAVRQMKPPARFLLDTFFSEVDEADAKVIDVDIVKGKRRMAPFVTPEAEGHLVERIGYTTNKIEPPYIKEKMATDAGQYLNREPGETAYSQRTPQQRAQETLGRDLRELDDMIARREEWMAANALDEGVITVSGDGIDATIDFGMSGSHKVTLSGTDLWDDGASAPLDNLRAWARLIRQDSGRNPNRVILGSSALDAFLNNSQVQNQLDTRRIMLGQIDPEQLPDGVTFYGTISELGIDIYSYDEWYIDSSGVEQPMVPAKKVWMGSTRARSVRHYAAIQDLDSLVAMRRFPKSWTQEDPSRRFVMLQSAPLTALHEPDAFLSAQVLA